jgi:hypothetical protein
MHSPTAACPTSRSLPFEPSDAAATQENGAPRTFGRLSGRVVPVAALADAQRRSMFALLCRYFAGVQQAQFEQDLAEKDSVILLADSEGETLAGFSTLMAFRAEVDGQPVVAFFSGDTVIDRDYWGETALPRLWAQNVFGRALQIRDARAYWFLICSGYKTYRFLPVFFREFYPTYARPTPPAEQRLLDTLGRRKFPEGYDPACGVVRLAHGAALRPGVAEIDAQRLADPHVAFFQAANPGHARGDELACITELTLDNLTPAGRRMLGLRAHPRGAVCAPAGRDLASAG